MGTFRCGVKHQENIEVDQALRNIWESSCIEKVGSIGAIFAASGRVCIKGGQLVNY